MVNHRVDRSIIQFGLDGPLATIHEDFTEDEFESDNGKGGLLRPMQAISPQSSAASDHPSTTAQQSARPATAAQLRLRRVSSPATGDATDDDGR